MKLDLMKAIFDRIEEAGPEAAAAFFGKTAATIAKWKSGSGVPDVAAAQKVLDFAIDKGTMEIPIQVGSNAFNKPPPQGKSKPETITEVADKAALQVGGRKQKPADLVELVKRATKFDILVPVNRPLHDAVVQSLLGNWKATLPEEIRPYLSELHFQRDTLPHHARNLLASRFLMSGNEWSFWMDSDIVAPIGNPKWFAAMTGAKWKEVNAKAAIERLTSRKRSFISGVYVERNLKGRLIASAGRTNAPSIEDKRILAEVRKGPQDKIEKVAWAGFGCVAVHRQVFLDILEKVPGVKSKDINANPHGFFTAFEDGPSSEDVAFAKRALQAGHPCHLDMSVFCGHIGNYAFIPGTT